MRRLAAAAVAAMAAVTVLVPLGACQKDTPSTEMTCDFLRHQRRTGVDVTIPDRCR